jgi:acyl carrier protein
MGKSAAKDFRYVMLSVDNQCLCRPVARSRPSCGLGRLRFHAYVRLAGHRRAAGTAHDVHRLRRPPAPYPPISKELLVNSEEILAQVRDIIAEVLDQPGLTIDRDTIAEDVQDWDSFNHINIVVAVQAHFGIKIHTAEVEEVRKVSELVDLIERKLKTKK